MNFISETHRLGLIVRKHQANPHRRNFTEYLSGAPDMVQVIENGKSEKLPKTRAAGRRGVGRGSPNGSSMGRDLSKMQTLEPTICHPWVFNWNEYSRTTEDDGNWGSWVRGVWELYLLSL